MGNGDGGVQTVQVSYKGGPVQVTMKALFSPFEPSSMDENVSRQTLTLRLSKEWEAKVVEVEQLLLERVALESRDIFGRAMTAVEVADLYKSCTRKAGQYPMNLRVKVNHTGMQSTRYWDDSGNRSGMLQTFCNRSFNVVINIRSMWFGENDAFGLVVDATDIQTVASGDDMKCPF